jgi:hypothetical protein
VNIEDVQKFIEKAIPSEIAEAKEKIKTKEGLIEHLKKVRGMIDSLIEKMEKTVK